jgi:hypothetical protein
MVSKTEDEVSDEEVVVPTTEKEIEVVEEETEEAEDTEARGKKRSASEDDAPVDKADGNGTYKDKTLSCRECEADFIFSSEEQDFFHEKGYTNEPVRCKECRAAKKARMDGDQGAQRGGGRGRGGALTCYNCQGEGHMSRDCPEPNNGGGRGAGGDRGPMTCYNCQGEGHMSRDCPQPRSGGGGGRGAGGDRGPMTCYNCQGEGHMSRDCPQARSGGGRGGGGRGRGGGGRGRGGRGGGRGRDGGGGRGRDRY